MRSDSTITFFPVGNGDTTLITVPDLSDDSDRNLNILIDSNIREGSQDAAGSDIFDVHAYLLDMLPRDPDGRPHLDVFILTHPDQDHCRGFKHLLFTGDPAQYGKTEAEEGRIILDELWFAPRIFWPFEELSDDAATFKDEAERRISLYKSASTTRSDAGNRLRVIGYTDNPDLSGLDDVLTIPGEVINVIDNKEQPHFRFLVLAPVRKDTDDTFVQRNDTSVVLHARFDIDGVENACTALFGGDSGCPIWERIEEINEADELAWDLLLAPHHCSWHFFSEESHETSQEPGEASIRVLEAHRPGAWIIASSKPLEDDDDDPPSYLAADLYLQAVGEDKFLCTGETPDRETPLPIVFLLTANGPAQGDQPKAKSSASAAIQATARSPKTYGPE